MTLSKSFRLLRFLNKTPPAPILFFYACLGFMVIFITTGRAVLAREGFARCWVKQDLKTVGRQTAWYMARSWARLDLLSDRYFDPTMDFSNAQLDVLSQFVTASAQRSNPTQLASDHAFICARRLDNHEDPDHRHIYSQALVRACTDLLATARTAPIPHTAVPPAARVGDFPITDAVQTLKDFGDLFPIDTLPWFVISGTFLGLIRENGFLPHDYDIDLGVYEDAIDVAHVISHLHQSPHFVLKKYDHHKSRLMPAPVLSQDPDVPFMLKIVHTTGVHIDLFVHYRDQQDGQDICWHGSSLHRWNNSAFDLVPYSFYDQTVLAPKQADVYLTECYGDWRTPVTEFNCTTDTPNLALVHNPIAVVIFLKMYVIATQDGSRKANRLQAELLRQKFLYKAKDQTLHMADTLF